MNDIERAIKNLRAYMYCEIEALPREVGIAISEAITALQEKLARENGCDNVEQSNRIDIPEDEQFSAVISGQCSECGGYLVYDDIFCPRCGRKLGSGEHE